MINVRKSQDRGHFNFGWLDTYHTFSFGDYRDPQHMAFRSLRVINEDRVAPGMGFDTHPHRNMEIITHILGGELAHRDSMGHEAVLRPGEIQRITAGRGIEHSEFNASQTEPVHLLQIWIMPEQAGLMPSYDQKAFPSEDRSDRLQLVCSRDGRQGSITIHQDADLYLASLSPGKSISHVLQPGRAAWVQVARGSATINGITLAAGDGAAVSDESGLKIHALENAELLLFDLA